jgi:hypothetical protein
MVGTLAREVKMEGTFRKWESNGASIVGVKLCQKYSFCSTWQVRGESAVRGHVGLMVAGIVL